MVATGGTRALFASMLSKSMRNCTGRQNGCRDKNMLLFGDEKMCVKIKHGVDWWVSMRVTGCNGMLTPANIVHIV